MHKVILRVVRATTVRVEKQYEFHKLTYYHNLQ
jgi:hypothetical protein